VSEARILAIESSCDETGVAVVVAGRRIEANQVATQIALHAETGGIVPEVAARQQLRWMVPTLEAAIDEAKVDWSQIDAIAVTCGPGLIGSLLVGVAFAKGLAAAHDLPLVPVNHIEGHIYANWLTDEGPDQPLPPEPPFPLLCLVVSGGHTQLILMHDHGRYDFSFSGLKTAVLREVAHLREANAPIPIDGLAASFEEAVVDALSTKTVAAADAEAVAAVALGGGVAANRSLRDVLRDRLAPLGLPLLVPPPAWCTDNGAMIGAAAGFRFAAGVRADVSLEAIPNLSLPWLEA
jgi:N6-L-threonylcarbamoyladenine synthase